MLGIVHGTAHGLDLGVDQEAADGRQIGCDAGGGSVGAVSGTESVVDENISQRSQSLGKLGIIGFFLGAETDVFQQHDLAGLDAVGHHLSDGADDVGGDGHLDVQELFQRGGNGLQAHLGIDLALGAAQMGAQDDGGIVLQQITDGGQSAADADIIGDLAVLIQRHVEIAAQEDFLSGHVDVLDRFFVVHTLFPHILLFVMLWFFPGILFPYRFIIV